MIRVVLADDHEMVRAGFKMILESTGKFEVVGEAAEGRQAYNAVSTAKPDLILLDISMPPGQSGLAACEDIAHDFPETKIIILTMYADAEYLYYTLKGGADGYVLKNSSASELLEAAGVVLHGGIYIHPKVRELLSMDMTIEEKVELSRAQMLSGRELEVLRYLAHGYTNREIAEKLFVSVKTVEAHRSKVYSKLGFKSRAELVEYAIRHNLMNL